MEEASQGGATMHVCDQSLEARFFAAVGAAADKPDWLIEVQPAPARMDAQGVDAIASVRYPNAEVVRVPIQLKGSPESCQKYRTEHPDAIAAGIVLLMFRPGMSAKYMMRRLTQLLDEKRDRGVRYSAYFASLSREELSRRAQRNSRLIEQRRRTEAEGVVA
jgi:hypothetical protein